MNSSRFCITIMFIASVVFMPRVYAQPASASAHPAQSVNTIPARSFGNHILWTEEFSGSTNTEGRVFSLDSSVGYVFSTHFGVDGGIPIYFVHGTSTTTGGATTTTSHSGLGDAYLQLRIAAANPVLNYSMVLTGTAPTGDSSAGLSTGHATYDWTNHFDRKFGGWTPFAEIGIGNSIPPTFIFNRPYESYGHDAHFQAGVGRGIVPWLSVNASAYDVAPWGTQTIFSRVVGAGGPPVGTGGHGRVFDVANQTTGSSSIAADNGFSAGADFHAGSLVDFSVGYSHSVHFQLNTFSFGIGLNMSELLRGASGI